MRNKLIRTIIAIVTNERLKFCIENYAMDLPDIINHFVTGNCIVLLIYILIIHQIMKKIIPV
jgi:hypothetical protein